MPNINIQSWPIVKHYDAPNTYSPFIQVGPARISFTQGYNLETDPQTKQQAEAHARLIAEAPVMLALLESLTFTAETVAHMRGLEREILPTTDKACELIARVKG